MRILDEFTGTVGLSAISATSVLDEKSWNAIQVTEAALGALSGHVCDKETKDPIEGVTVAFQDYSAETGTDGYYELPDLPPGTHEFIFIKAGYQIAKRDAMIVQDEWTTLDVELTPGEGPEPEPFAFPWWLVGIGAAAAIAIRTHSVMKKEKRS